MSDSKEDIEETLLQAMSVDDTPVLPEDYVAKAGAPLADKSHIATKDEVISALKTVSDPEIMINIYDMGLVYKIEISGEGNVFVEMTLTAPTCPVAGILPEQAANAIAQLDGTGEVEVKVVWEPAWSPEKMSQEAKDMLEMI